MFLHFLNNKKIPSLTKISYIPPPLPLIPIEKIIYILFSCNSIKNSFRENYNDDINPKKKFLKIFKSC